MSISFFFDGVFPFDLNKGKYFSVLAVVSTVIVYINIQTQFYVAHSEKYRAKKATQEKKNYRVLVDIYLNNDQWIET